jgi:hypothetical protein
MMLEFRYLEHDDWTGAQTDKMRLQTEINIFF